MDIANNEYLERGFTEIDNIVHCLYENGLFTDIECRKIVLTGLVHEARASIFEVIQSKDIPEAQRIHEIFRSRSFPTWNPKILKRIFSFLNRGDIKNCTLVCKDWNVVIDCLYDDKYSDRKIMNTSYDVKYPENKCENENADERKIKSYGLDKNRKEKKKIHFYYNLTKNEQKAVFFLVWLTRNPEEVGTTMLMIRKNKNSAYNYDLHFDSAAVIQPVLTDGREQIDNLIVKVLKNHMVLKNTFRYLSPKEVRTCRIVCRDWNHVAEPFIREKSIVRFRYGYRGDSFVPKNFLRVSNYSSVPNLHFKNFHFKNDFAADELATFFSKIGVDIRRLKFEEDLLLSVPLCLSFTSNLTELVIEGNILHGGNMRSDKMIPFDKLQSIKYITLKYCSIYIANNLEIRKITPVKIYLHRVTFYLGDNVALTINDFVDFTQAKDVKILGINNRSQIFDWATDTFKMEKMDLSDILTLNIDTSKSSVKYLKLDPGVRSSGKILVNIEHLLFKDIVASIDISQLPLTVKKLGFHNTCNINVNANNAIHLPYLSFLSAFSCSNYEFLSLFKHCTKLTHLEVGGSLNFDIRWLPRNVKVLNVNCDETTMKFIGENTEDFEDLDLLILRCITCQDLNNIPFVQIRSKKLVLQLTGGYQENEFISFIQRNKNVEKIYVHLDCYNQPSFSSWLESDLCCLVDKQSNFYEFSNGCGRSICKEEFFAIKTVADWQKAMKGFQLNGQGRTDDCVFCNDITSADGFID